MLEDKVSATISASDSDDEFDAFLRMSNDFYFNRFANPPFNARADASGISLDSGAASQSLMVTALLPRRTSRR